MNSVISMDEFCGNVGAKYQVVINDLRSRRCCNVIDDRCAVTIYNKLLEYPECERENVTMVSIDLSPFFHKLVEECFPNAVIAADKFHAVRLANNALDSIRETADGTSLVIEGIQIGAIGERRFFTN